MKMIVVIKSDVKFERFLYIIDSGIVNIVNFHIYYFLTV